MRRAGHGFWYPVYLLLCLGLSLLSFYYFETPVREWMLKRFHARPLETVALTSIAVRVGGANSI
jgi:peptidoglycan/LPS O-acetylase OafA/YrhL